MPVPWSIYFSKIWSNYLIILYSLWTSANHTNAFAKKSQRWSQFLNNTELIQESNNIDFLLNNIRFIVFDLLELFLVSLFCIQKNMSTVPGLSLYLICILNNILQYLISYCFESIAGHQMSQVLFGIQIYAPNFLYFNLIVCLRLCNILQTSVTTVLITLAITITLYVSILIWTAKYSRVFIMIRAELLVTRTVFFTKRFNFRC